MVVNLYTNLKVNLFKNFKTFETKYLQLFVFL